MGRRFAAPDDWDDDEPEVNEPDEDVCGFEEPTDWSGLDCGEVSFG